MDSLCSFGNNLIYISTYIILERVYWACTSNNFSYVDKNNGKIASATFSEFSSVVGLDLTSERLFVKSVLTKLNLHKNWANYSTVAYSGVSVETYFGDVIWYSCGHYPYCPDENVKNSLNYGTITCNTPTQKSVMVTLPERLKTPTLRTA